MLFAQNVTKYKNGKRVLDNITLSLLPHEVTVILGPSGCGKTSLLRCLCLLDLPDTGKIDYQEQSFLFPSKKTITKSIYPKVAMVFQEFYLWPHLRNRENIALPLQENGFSKKQVETVLSRLADELDLSAFLNRYPAESSVGQRQRIAIARCLGLEPQYLLLDEITSALDIVQINKLMNILKVLKQTNIAIALVTHNLDVARNIANHIIYMEEGKVVEAGSVNIIDSPQSNAFHDFLKS